MEQNTIELLFKNIEELNLKFDQKYNCLELRRQWIPKSEVMAFLGFAETQMVAITKKYKFITTTIGKKKFYHIDSLLKVFEKNQQ
jgi:hypothetical protein